MSFTPFILVTDRLVFVPTPISESIPGYRALFKKLHEDHKFCGMGFGEAFPAKSWTDDQIRYELLGRDVKRWQARNMGDFAVGILSTREGVFAGGRTLKKLPEVQIIELEGSDLSEQEIEWVGYSCARDCIPMLPPRDEGDAPLPPWQEMLEMRYGVSPEHWGKGLALEATRVVVQWAVEERGAMRFIAETLKSNRRSGRVLEKLGFRIVDTDYFKERDVLDEWEMVVS